MAEFRIKLDIKDLEITSQAINNKGETILNVKSTKTEPKFVPSTTSQSALSS